MVGIAVVGAGAWGTALASHAARQGHTVSLWSFEAEVAEEIRSQQRNSLYLPEAKLPEGIEASTDAERVVRDARLVVLVPPSKHLRTVAERLAGVVPSDAAVVVATKGIEEGTLQLLSHVLAEALPDVESDRVAFLSGPSFAKEVAAGLPTDVALASTSTRTAREVQRLLHAPRFRVYTSSDPVGVQVGGAMKNVMAVATGISDGLGLGNNARAAVITRGLAEMTRLGVALGADPLTFLGLAGVGDLVLTCTGDLSRNRTLGKKVAEGVDPAAYLAGQRAVAEGFWTSAAAHALAEKVGVDMPITEHVYHVLHRGRSLDEAVDLLVSREASDELAGIRETP